MFWFFLELCWFRCVVTITCLPVIVSLHVDLPELERYLQSEPCYVSASEITRHSQEASVDQNHPGSGEKEDADLKVSSSGPPEETPQPWLQLQPGDQQPESLGCEQRVLRQL